MQFFSLFALFTFMFVSFVLGVCAAIMALLLQSPFAETSSVSGIILLTVIEETTCFALLLAGTIRSVFTKNFFLTGTLFGTGFSLVEISLLESNNLFHGMSLSGIHIAAALFTLFFLSLKSRWRIPLAYTVAVVFHIAYNVAVF